MSRLTKAVGRVLEANYRIPKCIIPNPLGGQIVLNPYEAYILKKDKMIIPIPDEYRLEYQSDKPLDVDELLKGIQSYLDMPYKIIEIKSSNLLNIVKYYNDLKDSSKHAPVDLGNGFRVRFDRLKNLMDIAGIKQHKILKIRYIYTEIHRRPIAVYIKYGDVESLLMVSREG